MSAEQLRKAAALMRERAEAATAGPWRQHTAAAAADTVVFSAAGDWVTNVENCPSTGEHQPVPGGSICTDQAVPNGEHIASWHPAIALAVADLLTRLADRAADIADTIGSSRVADDVVTNNLPGYREALAVATAYLGEQP